ncbi:MAG: radical SAM protein [Lentisphaeria bacterium]|nr:radical SAM protein [Lentisphaeria bacterium]
MKCSLCPRRCSAVRYNSLADGICTGFCASPVLPVVARAGLHHWEEPVISGTKGSGTVFFSGCNLKCVFCQNYSISTERQGKEISLGRLKEIYRELIAQGAHNINLVTPGHYTQAVLSSLDEKLPVPVVYNSNGYDSVSALRSLEGKIDIYLPDLKYSDNRLAGKYSQASDYFETAAAAIDEMFRQTGNFEIDDNGIMKKGVIIRHLVLPGELENSINVIKYVSEHFPKGSVLFSLMRQYVPCGRVLEGEYPELNRRLSDWEYKAIESVLFDSGIEDGFLQDEESADTAFIPLFDGSGV